MLPRRSQLISLALPALIALIGVVWGLIIPPQSAYDDAYITYRYAANLMQGNGLVYNPGEWVLGVTTPLYALLLTPAGVGGLPAIIVASHWLAVACWIATAWLASALLRQAGYAVGAPVAGVLVIVQPVLLGSLGMETTLVTALMLLCAWAWLGRHTALAALSCAALILARQDAALWVLCLGLGVWVARSVGERTSIEHSYSTHIDMAERPFHSWIMGLPWREGVGSLLLTLPWFAFSYWRYGSLLPNSVTAKIGQRSAMHVTDEQPFLAGFLNSIQGDHSPWLVVTFFALAGLGVVAIALRSRRFWWLPIWLLAYLGIYFTLGVVNFPWYYGPPFVSMCLLAGIGVAWLAGESTSGQAGRAVTRNPIHARGLAAATLGVASALVLLPTAIDIVHSRNNYSLTAKPASYAAAGRWLAQHTPPETTIASIEIGIVGFWSQRSILDTMGLVSPAMSRHLTGWTDTLVYAVTNFWPDYALALPNTAWDPVVVQPWFQATYHPAVTLGNPPVTLYERVLSPPVLHPLPTPFNFGGQLLLSAFTFECGAGSKVKAVTVTSDGRCNFSTQLNGWLDLAAIRGLTANHQLTISLVDAATLERRSITQLWPYGNYNLYPTDHWRISERLHVPFAVALGAGETLPTGAYRLGLTIYDEATRETLLLRTTADDPSREDTALLGWLRVGDPPIPAALPVDALQFTPAAKWAAGLTLDKIVLPVAAIGVSNTLPVQLSWRVVVTPDRDLTLFLHLLDANGNIVAQLDRKPFGGRFPTPVWRPSEIVVDQVDLPLPPSLQPGGHALRIGLYDEAGRATLIDGDDSLLLPEAVRVR